MSVYPLARRRFLIVQMLIMSVLIGCSTEPTPRSREPIAPSSITTATPRPTPVAPTASVATITVSGTSPVQAPMAVTTQEPTNTPTIAIAPSSTPIPEPTSTARPLSPTPTPEPVSNTILDGDPAWHDAIQTSDNAYMGVITAVELNIRSEPSTSSEIIKTTFERHTVTVYELVTSPDDAAPWYRIGDGRYVSAWYVAPFVPQPPPETFEGRWIDVNLSTFYAVAYDGSTPVYSAIITAGRDQQTPTGVFRIFYRVRSETMDSATVGIPEGNPEYYYLENVEYTQYFKEGGFAVHGNDWTVPSEFGQFTSNGCVGLMNADAAWFWDFLSVGSVVSIHHGSWSD